MLTFHGTKLGAWRIDRVNKELHIEVSNKVKLSQNMFGETERHGLPKHRFSKSQE